MFNTSASRSIIVLLAVATAICISAPLSAREPAKIPASEDVSLYLNVEMKGGKLITGLGRNNFRLYVDGKPGPFRLEKPEEPASIALLVEYSRSSGYYFNDLDAAMQGFLKHAPEGNWYALATYSQDLLVNADFTKMTGEIVDAYSGLGQPMWNEINTYDAVYEMRDKMSRLPGRRILIITGSGIDTFSEHNLDDVKKKLESVNVAIFVAGAASAFRGAMEGYLSDSARMSLLQARAFLQMLADFSGGFAWFPNQSQAIPSIMEGTMQSIACQYQLVYQSPRRVDGKFHKIKVEAFRLIDDKREDFKVLVRSGWR
jgi:VWFA-related protein